jgi:hypothetical protein
MERGIRLGFVKTSEFGGEGVVVLNPHPLGTPLTLFRFTSFCFLVQV